MSFCLATGVLGGVGEGGLVPGVEHLVDEKLLDGLAVLEPDEFGVGLEAVVPRSGWQKVSLWSIP